MEGHMSTTEKIDYSKESVRLHKEWKGKIEVIATRERGQIDVKVTEGFFTFVALDENHRPRALPEV